MSEDTSGPHTFPFRAGSEYIDALGHMNHTKYFIVLEKARWQIIRDSTVYPEVRSGHILPVVLECEASFQKEIAPDQPMEVRTTVFRIRRTGFGFDQEIYGTDSSARHFRARVEVALISLKTRRVVRPPDYWVTALGLPPGGKRP